MKRVIAFFLTLILVCVAILPQMSFHAAAAETYSGTCGAEGDGSNLTWSLDTETGLLTIEGRGAMKNYVSNAFYNPAPWCGYRELITAVSLPEGLTSIGDEAFSHCIALTNVDFGNSVDSIGNRAFWTCSALTSVTIPDSVTSIGESAFEDCSAMSNLAIGNGVSSIDADAFSNCTGLNEIHINNLTAWCEISFGDGFSNPLIYAHNLYLNDELITDLIIPQGVTRIGNRVFWGCRPLTNVVIPNSVKWIGNVAFACCSGLTNVTIPNSVTSIGGSAFSGCTGLKSITIPSSVTSIGGSAFSGCTGLKSITIPNSVTSVGNKAFSGIEKITVESTQIGYNWFKNETALRELTIGPQVRTIEAEAFSGCAALAKVTMEEGVERICNRAFFGCTHLTSFTIPSSVSSIGSDIFENCTYLHELQLDVAEVSRANLACCYTQLSDVTITDPECLIEYDANTLGVPGQTVIHGLEGSTAQLYADRFSYQFEIYDPKPKPAFTDVKETDWYYNAVLWAIENGITGGVDETHFAPKRDCTREQVVTFLWAANGSPEPESTVNPFQDVKNGKYYYKPVLWAVENGITGGMDATHFGVGKTCDRSQVVMFLWAVAGRPEPETTENPFQDVKIKDYFYKAVLWAVENGVTGGTTPTSFSPKTICTRAQVVTFLYAAFGKEK